MVLFRKNLSGYLLALTLCFVVVATFADVVDRVVAVVNDDIILLSDVKEAIEKDKINEEWSESNSIFLEESDSQVLTLLIQEKLITQEIERSGITATVEEVDAALEHIKDSNGWSNLDEVLERDEMSVENFRHNLRKQILMNKLFDRYIYSKIIIADDKIRDYYDSNFKFYDGKLEYHLCSVLVDIAADTYHGNSNAVLGNMFDILRELDSGISFDNATNRYPLEGSGRAEYLGVFVKEDLSDYVKEAIEGLLIGESTQILKTKFGFQFFYIKDITRTEVKPLEMVRDEIYHKLLSEETEDGFTAWLNSLKDKSTIELFVKELYEH